MVAIIQDNHGLTIFVYPINEHEGRINVNSPKTLQWSPKWLEAIRRLGHLTQLLFYCVEGDAILTAQLE